MEDTIEDHSVKVKRKRFKIHEPNQRETGDIMERPKLWDRVIGEGEENHTKDINCIFSKALEENY